MADIVDNANDLTELQHNSRIEQVRQAAKQQQPGGRCLNCGEQLNPDQRFCDQDCRDDHQQREGMKTGNYG
jgi:uncharacterized OB-fold protein